ncbi:MAG: penicillin-binding protein 2 [Lachnospiraceae bacterium]|nr:penicillin-binding protein 2 [Lachnospiraceae bacterium]
MALKVRSGKKDKTDNRKKSTRGTYSAKQIRMGQLSALFAAMLILLTLLSVKLVKIVTDYGDEYQRIVLSNQRYDSVIIPFRRGDIVDCKGTILATSEKVYNLIIDASVMMTYDDNRYLEPTLNALSACFPNINIQELRAFVVNNESSHYRILAKRLTYGEISEFLNMQANNSYIRGVTFEEEYRRIYPMGTLCSTILGYTTGNTNSGGMYGLEEYYESVLTGTDGREYGYQNEDATLERTIKPAVDGYTIHTTIDSTIQRIVEGKLNEFNDTYTNNYRAGNGAENLGCIIMNINTGEILAMADFPGYNPSDYMNTDPLIGCKYYEAVTNAAGYIEYRKSTDVITQEMLDEMTQDQINVNLYNLWKNQCISYTYEPGSTAKPFCVAAALDSGAITGDEVYTCNGALQVANYYIKCHTYESGGDGVVTVQDSIAWSCNVALMKIAQTLGAENMCKYQRIFNLGLKTGIDLAGEARTDTLVYNTQTMGSVDLATNSFGQNFNATMIQMIAGFSSLINGGYYYEPHLVSHITDSTGAVVQTIEPRVLRQTVSESVSERMRQYCRATVMEEGGSRRSGRNARPFGYAIGGKTGTAQTIPRETGQIVISFMGFAPADDPQIAIYVVIDRPNFAKQDNVKYACLLCRDILQEVLPYMGIYMTEPLSDEEIRYLEEKQLENTLKYTQGTGSSESGDQTEDPYEEIEMTQITDSTGETANVYPRWMSYPIDPATGYRVGPDGTKYDADTGELAYGTSNILDDSIPVNDNLDSDTIRTNN